MKHIAISIVLPGVLAISGAACSHSSVASRPADQVKVKVGGAPASVTAAFMSDHPNSMIKQVLKQTYAGGHVDYVFTYVDASGKEQSATYDSKGNHVSG